MVIYPVDGVVHLSNNPGQNVSFTNWLRLLIHLYRTQDDKLLSASLQTLLILPVSAELQVDE